MMILKKFNKNTQQKLLHKKTYREMAVKKRTIIISIFILVLGIIYFTFARYETISSFTIIDGKVGNFNNGLLIDVITRLAKKGATDLEYDGKDSLGENGTLDNNLRYVGATPNNYVYYNCSVINADEMNDETCEKWRIIGIMNNIEDENGTTASRVKIMRDESLGEYTWDSTETFNQGYGINQWGESIKEDNTPYEGADLMRELNTDYLGNITVGTDGYWYDGYSNQKEKLMPTSTLNHNAQNMIQEVKWNNGASEPTNTIVRSSINMYSWERSEYDGKECKVKQWCNDDVIRKTTWVGKIALIYPSDYGYSTSGGTTTSKEICLSDLSNWNVSNKSDCKNNSWIYSNINQLTLMTFNAAGVYDIYNGAIVDGDICWGDNVKPALYLKNNIEVSSGDGSSSNPYKLVLK